jgi:hypothetical protein
MRAASVGSTSGDSYPTGTQFAMDICPCGEGAGEVCLRFEVNFAARLEAGADHGLAALGAFQLACLHGYSPDLLHTHPQGVDNLCATR